MRNPRRKALALLSFFALEAGLAAGPIRAGAEADPAAGPTPATRTAVAVVALPDPSSAPASRLATATATAAPAAAAAPAATAASAAAALVPSDRMYLQPVLAKAARDSGLPADLVLAQAWAESSWRVDAVSAIGAVGVLQLTPDTVDFVSKNLMHLDHDLDVHDPTANAQMGTVYLKHLLEHTDGDVRKALMAYNQGLRSLYQDGPDPEAQAYADTVLALRPVFTAGA